MAIHIQDEEADRMVRAFARQRGVGITAAVKLAVSEAETSRQHGLENFLRRIEPVLQRARAAKAGKEFSAEADKKFMDEMWGEMD